MTNREQNDSINNEMQEIFGFNTMLEGSKEQH